MDIILDALLDTVIDSLKLLPFLFLTYLLMEFLEHKASKKTVEIVEKAGKFGPIFGGLLGVVPQCGFSAAASNLYAGRVITMGTLLSIYLSTSDEMLPILISEAANPVLIMKILGIKVIIGMVAGFLLDLIFRARHKSEHIRVHEGEDNHDGHMHIGHMCDHEHCHCNEGNILKSACIHTLQIFAFIFAISLVLNILIGFVGEDALSAFLQGHNVLSVFVAGLVGLIPNCAASVVITEMFVEGFLSFGAMMSGLLVGAGVGILILFKVNDDIKDNLRIVGILYVVGVLAGLLMGI